MAGTLTRVLGALLLAGLLAGCATTWEPDEGDPAEAEAVWKRLAEAAERGRLHPAEAPASDADGDEMAQGVWRTLDAPWEDEGVLVEAAASEPAPAASAFGRVRRPPAAPAASPVRRVPAPTWSLDAPPPPRRPAPEPTDPQERARTHFLRHPTRIQGQRVTVHVPAGLAREMRLAGGPVQTLAGGRQRVSGDARFSLRLLQVRAGRITVRTDPDPAASFRLTVMGNAGFVSRVGERVFREEGAGVLLLINDRMTPMR